MLIGVIKHAGNNYHRIAQTLTEARRQPQVGVAGEQLKALKQVVSNRPVLNPSSDCVPGPYCRPIVLASDQEEGQGVSIPHGIPEDHERNNAR